MKGRKKVGGGQGWSIWVWNKDDKAGLSIYLHGNKSGAPWKELGRYLGELTIFAKPDGSKRIDIEDKITTHSRAAIMSAWQREVG